jgi:hypothetical protein
MEGTLRPLANQFHGCSLVPPSLHEQVGDLTFVVNRAPQARTAGPQLSRPSHRDATGTLAEGGDAGHLAFAVCSAVRDKLAEMRADAPSVKQGLLS